VHRFVPTLPDDGGVWSGEAAHWRVKSSYYLWFSPGILHLLYLMSQIWLNWMRRAIKADYECVDLEDEEKNVMPHPKDNNKTITSSAVDSVEIFTQVNKSSIPILHLLNLNFIDSSFLDHS
jgi:hypothetical protein